MEIIESQKENSQHGESLRPLRTETGEVEHKRPSIFSLFNGNRMLPHSHPQSHSNSHLTSVSHSARRFLVTPFDDIIAQIKSLDEPSTKTVELMYRSAVMKVFSSLPLSPSCVASPLKAFLILSSNSDPSLLAFKDKEESTNQPFLRRLKNRPSFLQASKSGRFSALDHSGGNFTITISGLRVADMSLFSHSIIPFLQLSLGGKILQTHNGSVDASTGAFVWVNETYEFVIGVAALNFHLLTVKLFAKNRFRADDCLGSLTIPLASLDLAQIDNESFFFVCPKLVEMDQESQLKGSFSPPCLTVTVRGK